MEQFKLYSPWGLSLMVATFNLAVVLSVASIVGYRPGAIAPVLAVLFVVPMALFESKIGQDELYYSVLEASDGPASAACFKQQNLAQFIEQQPEAYQAVRKAIGDAAAPLETLQRRSRWTWGRPRR